MSPPEYKTYSLRRKLLLTLLAAATLIWCVTAYHSYRRARHEVAQLYDAELVQDSRVILAFVDSSLDHGLALEHWNHSHEIGILGIEVLSHKYEKKVAFQLWDGSGQLILRTASAPSFPLSDVRQGFSHTRIDGHRWHVFSLPDKEGRFTIHVGQRNDIRTELTDDITRDLLYQYLIGMPLLSVTIWIIVGHSLGTLNRLAQAVKERKIDHLAPITTKEIPKEVKPLVDSLNSLLGRLEQAIEKERRFTADASHELRTPLAGLKTQAQVAMKAREEVVRVNALRHIVQGVDQMTHLVEQLLLLARMEQEPELLAMHRLCLQREVARTLSDLIHEAEAKQIDLSLETQSRCDIHANRQFLGILIRNLVDNAIRYTPEGGRVSIHAALHDDRGMFIVDDSGPGIPTELRERVFQRFVRAVETARHTHGSGLGLSIVSRIADAARAHIALDDSPLGGLRVTVAFPLAPRDRQPPNGTRP